jgi:hypothetical protein
MNVALGLKAHSGWAALVVVGGDGKRPAVIERQRIELVEPDASWAKAPYHAAEEMEARKAAKLVERATAMAGRVAERELARAVSRSRDGGNRVVSCAVLVPNPMPAWSTEQIRAVHLRMHQAEGVLFPEALCAGARACGLELVAIPEKVLGEYAEEAMGAPFERLMQRAGDLGKAVGAPWGKDQKVAALAAMLALQRHATRRPRPEHAQSYGSRGADR